MELASGAVWAERGVGGVCPQERGESELSRPESYSIAYRGTQGNKKLTQLLLGAGAKHPVKDKAGGTPLFAAIQSQDVDSAKLLLDAGAGVEVTLIQEELRRPLPHCLAQYELPEIAKLVLNRGGIQTLWMNRED